MGIMNACLYARFSPRRNAEDCESVEVQLDKARSYCRAMDYTIVGEFFDKAKSGKDRKRDGLNAAMKCAKENKALLVFRDFSRLSRDVQDSLAIRDELINNGAGMVDLEMRLDTSGPLGKMVFTIIQSVKQYQREDTSERTSEAVLWKQANGQKVSSQCPYGYRDGEKFKRGEKELTKIVPDKAEQAVIEQIMDLRGEGLGYRAIANRLNEEKIPCRGARWYDMTVSRVVKAQENGNGQR